MKPIRTQKTTRDLRAPEDWDANKYGECTHLPIVDSEGVMYSLWKPKLIDRVRVAIGRPIRLSICGLQHPPVMLDTETL